MKERTVIVHHHLFKNAGTSVDYILEQNFGAGFHKREFKGQPDVNSEQLAQLIADDPHLVAISTHSSLGPIPPIPGVRLVTFLLLRDPIERIKSAYFFERDQNTDNFGSVLARNTSLDGYASVRLSLPADRQCRNFQTWRLSLQSLEEPTEIARAQAGLEKISVHGRVENFNGAVKDLSLAVEAYLKPLSWEPVHMNKTINRNEHFSDGTLKSLLRANEDDAALVDGAGRISNLRRL